LSIKSSLIFFLEDHGTNQSDWEDGVNLALTRPKWRKFCTVFFGNRRLRFDKPKRKEVMKQVRELFLEILERLGDKISSQSAWRIAVRTWLQKNNLITVFKNGKVLPYYF